MKMTARWSECGERNQKNVGQRKSWLKKANEFVLDFLVVISTTYVL